VHDDVHDRIKREYPDQDIHVAMDIDFSVSTTKEKG